MTGDRRLKKLGNEADIESNPSSHRRLFLFSLSFQSLTKDLASNPALSVTHSRAEKARNETAREASTEKTSPSSNSPFESPFSTNDNSNNHNNQFPISRIKPKQLEGLY